MFRKLMQREPPRLFLGRVSVGAGCYPLRIPETNDARSTLDRALLIELTESLSFPLADEVETPLPTDLAFDVALQGYRFGSASELSLGVFGAPLFWRPRVRLTARLYYLQSGKVKTTLQVTRRMPWSAYLKRVFCWRVLLGLERAACRRDLEVLIRQARERLEACVRKVT